jgi:hypothetical protein
MTLFGLGLTTLLPAIIIILGIIKSLADTLASLMAILANISTTFNSLVTVVLPVGRSLSEILGSVLVKVKDWLFWFLKEVWDGVFVMFHQPSTFATFIFFMLCAISTTAYHERQKCLELTQEAVLEARKHAQELGFKTGYEKGRNDAKGRRTLPNR